MGENRRREKLNQLKKKSLGKAVKWLVNHAKEIGIDIDSFEHEITDYFKSHVLKEHGDPEKEKLKGQIAINEDDFEKIADIVENPNLAMIGAKRDGKDIFYYVKKMDDGTTLYVEEILNGKKNKGLQSKTMFKRKKDVSADKFKNIVSMNNRTNISKVKIVNPVGTGSNPSYTPIKTPVAVANPVQPSGQLSNLNIPQPTHSVNEKNNKNLSKE
jgi:hypothetical protein